MHQSGKAVAYSGIAKTVLIDLLGALGKDFVGNRFRELHHEGKQLVVRLFKDALSDTA